MERAGSVKEIDLEKELPVERTLGVQWNVAIKQKEETRRGVLSMISSVYDPLGFLVPFILLAKILLQNLCCSGLGWDEPISPNDLSLWRDLLADLPGLSDIAIARCFKPPHFEPEVFELHNFCDAGVFQKSDSFGVWQHYCGAKFSI